MTALQIADIKTFMKQFLLSETFDHFLLLEGNVTTFAAFHIDGTLHPSYFQHTGAGKPGKPHALLLGRGTPFLPGTDQRETDAAFFSFHTPAVSQQYRKISGSDAQPHSLRSGARPAHESSLRWPYSSVHHRHFPLCLYHGQRTGPCLG